MPNKKLCPDCGADITLRGATAQRCASCAKVYAAQLARRNRADEKSPYKDFGLTADQVLDT